MIIMPDEKFDQKAYIREYLKENIKAFRLSVPKQEFERFKEACDKNKTTPTTVLRKLMADYVSVSSEEIVK